MNRIDEAIQSGVLHTFQVYEREIRLCIKPKPAWMPMFLYKWFLKQLIIEERSLPLSPPF